MTEGGKTKEAMGRRSEGMKRRMDDGEVKKGSEGQTAVAKELVQDWVRPRPWRLCQKKKKKKKENLFMQTFQQK